MNLDYNFFKIDGKQYSPKQGRVLISEPFLSDSYFKRSIVLLTEHNDEGTVGFVLNKPVDLSVNEVLKDFPEMEANVSIGGPVGTNTIHYLHTVGQEIPNSVHVLGDIYWGGDFDSLKSLVETGKIGNKQVRFFVGYSGWKPKQLENEISENSWIVTELESGMIMNKRSFDSWKDVLQQLGEDYKIWINSPDSPTLN